jgi:hypothetical protein
VTFQYVGVVQFPPVELPVQLVELPAVGGKHAVPFQIPVQLAGLGQFVPVQLVVFVVLQKVPFQVPEQLAGLVVLQKVPFQLPEQFAGLLVQLVPVQLVVQTVPLVVLAQVVVQLQVIFVD